MRRILATLVVALVSLSLIAPILLADDAQSNLPACCRRDGHHHCGSSTGGDPQGTTLRAAKCPMFPAAKTLPGRSLTAGLGVASAFFAALVSHPAITAQTQVLLRISHDRAAQKRGPPSLS